MNIADLLVEQPAYTNVLNFLGAIDFGLADGRFAKQQLDGLPSGDVRETGCGEENRTPDLSIIDRVL